MNLNPPVPRILLADDDPEDRMLAVDALEETALENILDTVEDGEELMEFLRRTGRHAHRVCEPLPGLILLDLNMPRKDGREALKEIKSDPLLCSIPVIALTTSNAEEDIRQTYELGVNSFITKPVTYTGLVNLMNTIATYWFDLVELPPEPTSSSR